MGIALRLIAPVLVAALAAGCSKAPRAPDGATPEPATPAEDAATAVQLPAAVPAEAPAEPAAPSDLLDTLVRADDTFDSLRARLGESVVVRETLPGGEGTEIPGWVLYPADATRRVEIVPDESGRHPSLLTVGEGSHWRRGDGVRPGIDTLELERLNGGPFEFTGFDWDYGGLVMDWKAGRLAREGRFAGPVRLCAPATRPDGYPMGDREFASSLPVVRANPATVCEVGISFDAE